MILKTIIIRTDIDCQIERDEADIVLPTNYVCFHVSTSAAL